MVPCLVLTISSDIATTLASRCGLYNTLDGQPQWADPAEYLDFANSSAKSRSVSPQKSRSPSKRSWEEVRKEPGEQGYTSQNPNDEPALDVARGSPDHHYAKRARRRSLSTSRQNTIAPLLPSYSWTVMQCDCQLLISAQSRFKADIHKCSPSNLKAIRGLTPTKMSDK